MSISEPFKTLNDLASSGGSLVGTPEFEFQDNSYNNDKATGDHTGSDTWDVCRLVLIPEHGSAHNSANTPCANQSGRRQGTLPEREFSTFPGCKKLVCKRTIVREYCLPGK